MNLKLQSNVDRSEAERVYRKKKIVRYTQSVHKFKFVYRKKNN